MPDNVGAQWNQLLKGKGYTPAGNKRFLERFRNSPYITLMLRYAQLPQGSLVLEPGCGSGKFSLVLASLQHRVIALDYVSDVLHGVRTTELGLGDGWDQQLKGYCKGSLERLPYPDDTFDLVINEGVVEHWLGSTERILVLREMTRITCPGGTVAVLVPNGAHPLIRTWEARQSGHLAAPPMTYYSAERLGQELTLAGLSKVQIDGIYPWRSWVRLPPWDRLYLVAATLDRWAPLPKRLRKKWGMNIVGLGRKGG